MLARCIRTIYKLNSDKKKALLLSEIIVVVFFCFDAW